MKSFLLTLLIFLLVIKTGAQVHQGDLLLSNQAEVDSFNYSEVIGDLIIQESAPGSITNLNGLITLNKLRRLRLSELSYDGGDLKIQNNSALENFDGLSNLTTIEGSLYISENAELTNINGLSGLTSLRFNLGIGGNPKLLNLDGLSGLVGVSVFSLSNNNSLKNIDALSNIRSFSRPFDAGAAHRIVGNPSLENINGLSNLRTAEDFLEIAYNDKLKDIDALSSLTNIQELEIHHNPALTSIRGISHIVGPFIGIHDNLCLHDFCALYNTLIIDSSRVYMFNNGSNPTKEEIIAEGPCESNAPRSFIASIGGYFYREDCRTSIGGGMFVLNKTQDTLSYWITLCDLCSDLTEVQFHKGRFYETDPHPVVKTITTSFIGDRAQGIWTSFDPEPLTPELVANILDNNIYVDIHTVNYPEGEIRGLLNNRTGPILYSTLNGEQVVPPNNEQSSGTGGFTLSGDGSSLFINVSIQSLSGDLQSVHLHKAGEGENGPIIKDITNIFTELLGRARWSDTDSIPLVPDIVAELLACGIYIDVHTSSYPDGEIRGQLYPPGHSNQNAVTDIEETNQKPLEYSLAQNYPNPFNPNTTISFALPERGLVELKIYSTIGEEIITLLNDQKDAGYYNVKWQPSGMAAGIYICRIIFNNKVLSRKMVYLK